MPGFNLFHLQSLSITIFSSVKFHLTIVTFDVIK